MFKGFAAIRTTALAVVYMRRMARFLHDIKGQLYTANELRRLELEFKYPAQMKAWHAERKRVAGPRKPLEVSVATYGQWDRNWRETHAPGYDPDDEGLNES